jgi:GrpB-like predicted nucleotidyltransferase (UPF0157 family)
VILMPAAVVIAEYDPCWPARFARLRHQLVAALGPLAVRIEHVGSTAVPGRAANAEAKTAFIDSLLAAR